MAQSNPSGMVSVIIPVHNGGNAFEKCLSSVMDAMNDSSEIIVVADGESDGSYRLAEKYGATLLKIPVAGGPAKARNLGAREARGDILFFTDADVTIPPDTIDRIEAAFKKDVDLAALFGSYDDTPSEPNLLSQYRNLMHHYVHQTSNEDAATFWTGCGAIRRDIFLKMGGFSEAYRFPSIEDIELGSRMKKEGYTIHLKKEIQVKHLKCWKLYSMLRADFFFRALPWTELILKEKLPVNDLNLKPTAKISTLMVLSMLICLLLAPILPASLLIAGISYLILFFLNWDLYHFFTKKRGVRFTLKILPFHWLYFFYSGLAFTIGYLSHRVKRI